MEDLERTQDRLDRIESIEPVLSALRTISLASWRQALRRREDIQAYSQGLLRVAAALPADTILGSRSSQAEDDSASETSQPVRRAILVLGSERGLCGRFNIAAIERVEELVAQGGSDESALELLALGSRLGTMLCRRGHDLDWLGKLSLTALPPFGLAEDLTARWLGRYRQGSLDELCVVHNDYGGVGEYETKATVLLPPSALVASAIAKAKSYPPAIVETDLRSLFEHLVDALVAARLYSILIRSAAAEHSTRYQLMDGASRNAERIIDELTLTIQDARKQAITREMQELAAGAGLIGERS